MIGMGKILIRQKRSLIGQPEKMRRVVRALGLRRIRHSVIKKDTNCIRGMINKAIHLVEYELELESGKEVAKLESKADGGKSGKAGGAS